MKYEIESGTWKNLDTGVRLKQMTSPDNPRGAENSLSPQEFARVYDGRPLDEVAAGSKDHLPIIPGWVVDGNVPPQVWQKISGGVIPLVPFEGEVGEEARELVARKENKYGGVLPVIARLPAGRWCPWESGYIRLADLDKSVSELFGEFETAVTNFLDQRKKVGYEEKWRQWALISMLKLALIAKTPPKELNNSTLVEIFTKLTKVF